jgi:hypothetical protein
MTMVFLNPGNGPLKVTLTLDSTVYLYSAELYQDCGANTALVPGSKTEDTAEWTGITPCPPDAPSISFAVRWEGVHNVTPGQLYTAELIVEDAGGARLLAQEGSTNPTLIPGQIGPASNPTDFGRVGVFVG